MEEQKKKWLKLPKKTRTAAELKKWFSETPHREQLLTTIIADQLRTFGMEQIIWARTEEQNGLGLFEYADPFEEAESIINRLRMFGFLDEPEETP
jgi:muconolactone delta-isomerase